MITTCAWCNRPTAAVIFARIRTVPAANAAINQVCAPSPRSRNQASAAERALGTGGVGAPPGSCG